MTKLVFKVRAENRYAGFKFPLRLRPLEDELLSSWLIRLALLHRTMPSTFTNLYLPETKNRLWSADLDLQSDPYLLEMLSKKCDAPVEALKELTFGSYEGFLFEKLFTTTGAAKFIIPLRMRGRQSTSYGLRYCPKCLQEDPQPYFRRKWRLSFSTACVKHRCFLRDRCPDCQSPLTIYRKPVVTSFPNCDKCGFSFKNAAVESIPKDSYGLKAIQQLYEILDSGFILLSGVPVYSFLFFNVIHQLWKAVYFWDRTDGFLAHEIMRDHFDDLAWEPKAMVLEEMRLKEQYLSFSGLMWLFEDFSQNLFDYCIRNKLGKTELTRDLSQVPFWYKRIVDRFDQTFWRVDTGEISGAIDYINRRGMQVSRQLVADLIGRGLDFRKRKDIELLLSCALHSPRPIRK